MAACTTPIESTWKMSGDTPYPVHCGELPADCAPQDFGNLQFLNSSCIEGGQYEPNIPHENVWCDENDGLADIISGPLGYEIDSGFVVPNSSQVLYSDDLINMPNRGCQRRCHHHSRGSCCFSDRIQYPNISDIHSFNEHCGDKSQSKTTSNSSNKSKVFIKRVKSNSCSSSSSVKKTSENHSHHHGGCCSQSMVPNCQYVQSTRMVPKVSVQPRVRYIPQVTNERIVRYVPNTELNNDCEVKVVSNDGCSEPLGKRECHCQRRCKEAVICQTEKSEDQCSFSSSEDKSAGRKIGCW